MTNGRDLHTSLLANMEVSLFLIKKELHPLQIDG